MLEVFKFKQLRKGHLIPTSWDMPEEMNVMERVLSNDLQKNVLNCISIDMRVLFHTLKGSKSNHKKVSTFLSETMHVMFLFSWNFTKTARFMGNC